MWGELAPVGRSAETGGYFRQPFASAETELRHWFVERYIGQFVSPSLFYANYTIGYDKRTFKGNAYGIGCSWGYSKLLSTRWNFIVEIGAGIVYTPYTEKLRPKYIGEFDDEYTYRHRRFLLVPIKCNLSFSYLF